MQASDPTADYTVKTFDEMEAAAGGMFIRARASLGASAFGFQVLDLPPDSGNLYPEHDHGFDGQEEVYLLLEGTGQIVLPGGPVELTRERMIRVGPNTRRRLRSGPDGARVLVIGAAPGRPYAPAANSELGADPSPGDPGASSEMLQNGPPPQLDG